MFILEILYVIMFKIDIQYIYKMEAFMEYEKLWDELFTRARMNLGIRNVCSVSEKQRLTILVCLKRYPQRINKLWKIISLPVK